MPTQRPPSWLPLTLMLLLTACLPIVAGGQDADPQDQEPGEVAPKLLDINFNGGTVAEYIQQLTDQWREDENGEPQPWNVVVNREALNYPLPEIKVRTTPEGALLLLEYCNNSDDSRLVLDQSYDGDTEITFINLDQPNPDPEGVTVINVRQLLSRPQELNQESLLSAIEIGLEMQEKGSSVTMRLHEETGLLFVKGPSRATNLVENIVRQLQHGVAGGGGGVGGMQGPFGMDAGGLGIGGGLGGGAGQASGGGAGGGSGLGGGSGRAAGGGSVDTEATTETPGGSGASRPAGSGQSPRPVKGGGSFGGSK